MYIYVGTFVVITILNYRAPNKVETIFKSHNKEQFDINSDRNQHIVQRNNNEW